MSITETIELVTPEIPWGVAEAIASWRRIIYQTIGEKRPNFQRAAHELMRLADAQAEAFSRQVIVDALAGMAETAGMSPDDAQAMMHAGAVSQWDVPIGMSHGTVTAMDYADLLGTEFPPRKALLAPWLPSKGTAMVYGWRGLGKTFLVHASAWAIATGGGFLRWTTEQPRRVLVLDGEMPMAALQERFRAIEAGSALRPQPGYLRIAAADMCRDGLPDLADPKAQEFYADVLADADVVFVDNLSTLCPYLKENDAEDYAPFQAWVLRQRREGRSAVLVHHGGKSGSQRGSSKKEDILDTVICIRRPPDYSAEQGARFEIHFEKSRGFYGPDAEPFEAQLIGNQWRVAPIKSGDDDETLRALKSQGLSIREISDRTGVPRSTVHRKLNGSEETAE
jgi:AAA domain/IclR helix-turn-helix domain